MANQKDNVITPPKRLSDKVARSGGPSAPEAIGKALKMADNLIDSYQGWAVDDLQTLWETFNEAEKRGADPTGQREGVRDMFNVAHEIRGQGGSFGYPLISTVADSLCKFLEPRGTLSPKDAEIVRIHILALKAVFAQQLKGDQDDLQGELRPLLHTLRAKA